MRCLHSLLGAATQVGGALVQVVMMPLTLVASLMMLTSILVMVKSIVNGGTVVNIRVRKEDPNI